MLETFMNYYEKLDITINNDENNEKIAVIVEPRNHKYLIPVIKQVMSKLGNTWNLQIFGSDMNEKLVRENIKGNYKFINMGINDLVSPSVYSLLLQSTQFWDKIKEEHIIIFQTDSFIVNINDDYKIPTKYGFLGAKYNHGRYINDKHIDYVEPLPNTCNLNGGFSYRKKSVMLDCINKVSYDDIIQHRKSHNLPNELFLEKWFIIPEDVFFCNAMVVLGYDYPLTLEEEITFCINHFSMDTRRHLNINPLTCLGIHPFDRFKKTDIDYICGELLKRDAVNY